VRCGDTRVCQLLRTAAHGRFRRTKTSRESDNDILKKIRKLLDEHPQTSNLRFIPIEDGNVIGFVKESVNQTNSVVGAMALSREVHEFWFPLGDVPVGMSGDRRYVAALENLSTGERYPVEWGGIRLRIDPVRDPAMLFRCLA
jgi:starch synthase (maltosyl-transferring)